MVVDNTAAVYPVNQILDVGPVDQIWSSLGDTSNTAMVIDQYHAISNNLVLRGIQGGAGISVTVTNADDNPDLTTESKIVISLAGTPPGPGPNPFYLTGYNNLGTGISVVEGLTGSVLEFLTLQAGTNITLGVTSTDITINSNSPSIFLSGGSGGGISLIDSITATTVTLRGLLAGPGIGLNVLGENIQISASPIWANGSTSGVSLVDGAINGVLTFNTLQGGNGISVTNVPGSGEIVISYSGAGVIGSAQNEGPGVGVFDQVISGSAYFKSLVAGPNSTITNNGSYITIDSLGEDNDGINLGTFPVDGEAVYYGKQSGTPHLLFRRIKAGNGIYVAPMGSTANVTTDEPAEDAGTSIQINLIPPNIQNLPNDTPPNVAQNIFTTSQYNGLTNGYDYFFKRIKGINGILATADDNAVILSLDSSVAYLNQPNIFTNQIVTAPNILTLGSQVNWDLNVSNVAFFRPSGIVVLNNPINQQAGGVYWLLVLCQGTNNVIFNSAYSWINGTPPTLSQTAGTADLIMFISDGTRMWGSYTLAQGFGQSPKIEIDQGLILTGQNNQTLANFFSHTPIADSQVIVKVNGLKILPTQWSRVDFDLTVLGSALPITITSPTVVEATYLYYF